MPTKAGIRNIFKSLDSGFRRNDGAGDFPVIPAKVCIRNFNINGFRLSPE